MFYAYMLHSFEIAFNTSILMARFISRRVVWPFKPRQLLQSIKIQPFGVMSVVDGTHIVASELK